MLPSFVNQTLITKHLRFPFQSCSQACYKSFNFLNNFYSTIENLASLNDNITLYEHENIPANRRPVDEPGRRKRILSGVQPTGKPTIGNYLGALKNWVQLQDDYDNFFCVMDLHAITAPYDPRELRQATRDMAALYLASGIDPAKSTVFVQSHVPAHTGLAWLLSCHTPVNWLARQAQFAEKSSRLVAAGIGEARTGLLTYPVLMAADILLYQTDLVPVGDDQRQHLQVAKELAFRLNRDFTPLAPPAAGVEGKKGAKGKKSRPEPLFRMPEIFTPPSGARIMSLQDGRSKMSKSAPNDNSRINLTDSADQIRLKIRRCKTDSIVGMEWGNPDRPECTNLLTIYHLCSGKSKEEVAVECQSMNWGTFKQALLEAVVEHLKPIQERYRHLQVDPAYLDSLLAAGAETASGVADRTLHRVRESMGFLPQPGKF